MSQFQRIRDATQKNAELCDQFNQIWNDNQIPVIFREKCSPWIENQQWLTDQSVGSLFRGVLEHLSNLKESEISVVMTLNDLIRKLQVSFLGKENIFVENMKNVLQKEAELLNRLEDDENDKKRKGQRSREPPSRTSVNVKLLMAKMDEQFEQLQTLQTILDNIESYQNQFILEKVEMEDLKQREEDNALVQASEGKLGTTLLTLFGLHKLWITNIVMLATRIKQFLQETWAEIRRWSKDRRLAVAKLAKVHSDDSLLLDCACSKAGSLFAKLLDQTEMAAVVLQQVSFENEAVLPKLAQLRSELDEYLKQHVKEIFVVFDQPLRILKLGNSKSPAFSMSVALLGAESLGLCGSQQMPKVQAKLFSDQELMQVLRTGSFLTASGACHLANGDNPQAFKLTSKCLREAKHSVVLARFSNVQIQKFQRNDRGKEDLVTDFKYGMVFHSEVTVRGQIYQLSTCSLPMVLTTQTSQECMALGTLVWDAIGAKDDRVGYEEPQFLEWKQIQEMLNAHFLEATEKSLDSNQLMFLAKELMPSIKPNEDFSEQKVSRSRLIKMPYSSRPKAEQFSYWKWFFCCLNLVKDHMVNEWRAGLITGFVSKEDCRKRLQNKPEGTFIVRFSQSEVENSQRTSVRVFLTVAVNEIDPMTGSRKVFFIKDYLSPKNIEDNGISALLSAFEVKDWPAAEHKKQLLRRLWPNMTLQKAVKPFVAEPKGSTDVSDDGYLYSAMKIEIFLVPDSLRPSTTSTCENPSSPLACSVLSPVSGADDPTSPVSAVNSLGSSVSEARRQSSRGCVQPLSQPTKVARVGQQPAALVPVGNITMGVAYPLGPMMAANSQQTAGSAGQQTASSAGQQIAGSAGQQTAGSAGQQFTAFVDQQPVSFSVPQPAAFVGQQSASFACQQLAGSAGQQPGGHELSYFADQQSTDEQPVDLAALSKTDRAASPLASIDNMTSTGNVSIDEEDDDIMSMKEAYDGRTVCLKNVYMGVSNESVTNDDDDAFANDDDVVANDDEDISAIFDHVNILNA